MSYPECDTDKQIGLEDFGLLLRPLGLTEKKLVPDPIAFTEPDPLGARVYSSTNASRTVAVKGNSWGLQVISALKSFYNTCLNRVLKSCIQTLK